MKPIADLDLYRTLVYLEGEASMSQFQDAEGKSRSALNIVQRQSTHPHSVHSTDLYSAERLEVLSPKKSTQ